MQYFAISNLFDILHISLFLGMVPATHDLWILGDAFLQNIFNEFCTWKSEADNKKSDMVPPYMNEYFNVKPFFKGSFSDSLAITRVNTALLEAVNEKNAQLPKFLVVLLDNDLLMDLEMGISDADAQITLQKIVMWLV